MPPRPKFQDTRGAALLLCIAFTAAAVSLVLVLSTRTIAHARQAESMALVTAAFSAAEVAQAQALADLRVGGVGNVGYTGILSWSASGPPALPAFDDSEVNPMHDAGPPEVAWFAATAQPPALPDLRVVYAFGRAGNVVRCLETVLRRDAASAWQTVTWRELPSTLRGTGHAPL